MTRSSRVLHRRSIATAVVASRWPLVNILLVVEVLIAEMVVVEEVFPSENKTDCLRTNYDQLA